MTTKLRGQTKIAAHLDDATFHFAPLWQRAHEAGLQPNMVALLRCLYEEGKQGAMGRFNWDYDTLRGYEQRAIARLRLIDPALADEAETLLAPRTCDFCGHSPAPYKITRLTPEQREANQAWSDSLKEAFHTGHCPYLELPTYACQPCYDDHPECHLTRR